MTFSHNFFLVKRHLRTAITVMPSSCKWLDEYLWWLPGTQDLVHLVLFPPGQGLGDHLVGLLSVEVPCSKEAKQVHVLGHLGGRDGDKAERVWLYILIKSKAPLKTLWLSQKHQKFDMKLTWCKVDDIKHPLNSCFWGAIKLVAKQFPKWIFALRWKSSTKKLNAYTVHVHYFLNNEISWNLYRLIVDCWMYRLIVDCWLLIVDCWMYRLIVDCWMYRLIVDCWMYECILYTKKARILWEAVLQNLPIVYVKWLHRNCF